MMFPFSIGIRTKLLLISSVLLAIPWLGYQYVGEMEKFLRAGQESTLAGTARAVATALHNRPKLFDGQAVGKGVANNARDLYIRSLPNTITVDGLAQDWPAVADDIRVYGPESVVQEPNPNSAPLASFKLRVGQQDDAFFALIEVTDPHVIYRFPRSNSVANSDYVEIALVSPGGEFNRYTISPTAPGWFTANLMSTGQTDMMMRPDSRIKGKWIDTPQGYTIELRMPLSMVGARLAFAVANVDDPEIEGNVSVVGTSGVGTPEELGAALVPAADIDQIISGLGRTTSRIWIIDRHQRVLAHAGSLRPEDNKLSNSVPPQNAHQHWGWSAIKDRYLRPVYTFILNQPTDNFQDDLKAASQLQGTEIDRALSGIPATRRRSTPDSRAVILSAAYPVWSKDHVIGAVVVEETTNAIVTIKNQAFEKLFTVILGVFLFGSLALFLFASRVSSRIRRLRNEAEQSIDSSGRVRGIIAGTNAGDEIGDLSRSFSSVLERLSQYNSYLENMASRLSHEIRTPVAVVRSSLDNLAMEALPDEAKVYMGRAQEGLARLNVILTRMSEATRLEQVLQQSEQEQFDLAKVVAGCAEGYKAAYPRHTFVVRVPAWPMLVHGVPDLIAQMLDKLVSNAVDFSTEGTNIEICLAEDRNWAALRVLNEGPALPTEMAGQLFESMISIRPRKESQAPHLGLGLYIVRLISEFHHGQASIANRHDKQGVVAQIMLPLDSQFPPVVTGAAENKA